jgi:hypothetical protein
MTTGQVLAHWQVANSELQLRTRRLRWALTWATDLGNHTQALDATLGQLKVEFGATYVKGRGLTETANPWAERLVSDLMFLSEIGGVAWLIDDSALDILQLLFVPNLVEHFIKIDLTILRVKSWSKCVAPWGQEDNGLETLARSFDDEGLLCEFECGECGRACMTRLGLLAHMRAHHRHRSLYSHVTVTNHRCFCMSSLASRI